MRSVEGHRGSYLSDAPLTRPEQDEFRRWPFAKRIAESIKSRRDASGVVIGIYGAWGSGKTSVLRFIHHALADDPKIVRVWFNPWRYRSEDQLIRSLMEAVATALRTSIEPWGVRARRKVGKVLKRGGPAVSASGAGMGASLPLGDLLKGVGDVLDPDDLDIVKRRFEGVLRAERRRVVIMMDDLDRLERADIQAVFRLVKLSADFENTTYVLALDPEWVAGALRERYGHDTGTVDSGLTFLEKIIQVPLQIPRPDRARLVKYFSDAVTSALRAADIELTDRQVQTYSLHFHAAFSPRLSVPRQAVRHHNALLFVLPLLRGEVDLVDLLLLEGLRAFYPAVYDLIWQNPNIFVWSPVSMHRDNPVVTKQADELIAGALKGLKAAEAEAVQELLTHLFPARPRGDRTSSPSTHQEERLIEGKRVGSYRCFDRYFLYSVAEGDVSDQEVDAFLSDLAARSAADIAVEIRKLVGKDRAEVFVEKLRARRGGLTAAVARRLGEGIAKAGDAFRESSDGAELFSPRSQAASLVNLLVAGMSAADRYAMAHLIVTEAQPLPFACECYIHIVPEDRTREREPLLTVREDADLGASLLARIRAAAKAGGLLHDFGRDSSRLLYLWSILSSPDETRQFVAGLVEGAPLIAVEILRCYLPRWTSDDLYEFEMRGYQSLAKVADPAVLERGLKRAFGDKVFGQPAPIKPGPPEPEELAKQFMVVHRAAQGKAGEGSPGTSGEG